MSPVATLLFIVLLLLIHLNCAADAPDAAPELPVPVLDAVATAGHNAAQDEDGAHNGNHDNGHRHGGHDDGPGHAHDDAHGGHDHDHDHEWEYSAVYKVPTDGLCHWVASQFEGRFADREMKLLFLRAREASSEGLHALESSAHDLWEGSSSKVFPTGNDTMTVGNLYTLIFNSGLYVNSFPIAFGTTTSTRQTAEDEAMAIFAEHYPSEFSKPFGGLIDPHGEQINAEFVNGTETHLNVGEAIGASFCVVLATLIGVILLIPGVLHVGQRFHLLHGIDAFASGALLSLVIYLTIPEAIEHIEHAYRGARGAAWFGSLLIAGFITPILIEWFTDLLFPGKDETGGAKDELEAPVQTSYGDGNIYPVWHGGEDIDPVASAMGAPFPSPTPLADNQTWEGPKSETLSSSAALPSLKTNVFRDFFKCCPWTPVVWSVTIGDALHNFADGVLIGVAFRFCGSSLGWTVTGAAIAHELAAELSEFWLLINPETGNLNWLQALVLNFIAGLTCVIGTLMVLYIDFTDFTVGLVFAFSGGVLLFIATIPIWARLLDHKTTLGYIAVISFFFVFGLVAISLVLLNHEHCDIGGGHGHGHDHDHDHGHHH